MGGLYELVDPELVRRLCSCGRKHPSCRVRCFIGHDAARRMADDIGNFLTGKSLFLLDDRNTRDIAGSHIRNMLENKGLRVKHMTLDAAADVTSETVERVFRDISCPFAVAVGSGTVNDILKAAADRAGIPYYVFATAPSMNGYASGIAAIKVAGVKRTLPAAPVGAVYADPKIFSAAPRKMRTAGFCDLLAKSVSDFDWRAAAFFEDNGYCALPSRLTSGVEEDVLHAAEKIASGDHDRCADLMRGLLVSGAAMTLAGSSAPASGGEHLLSHFLDMRTGITGRRSELHGLQVGLGILLSANVYALLANCTADDFAGRAAAADRTDLDKIAGIWGDLTPEVRKRFAAKRAALARFPTAPRADWEKIVALSGTVRRPSDFLRLFRCAGFPASLAEFRLDADEFMLAATGARTIRERITVLDIAAHAGVLEKAAQNALAMFTDGQFSE